LETRYLVSYRQDTIWFRAEAQDPFIDRFHLAGNARPGVFALNELPATPTHFVAFGIGEAQCMAQGIRERDGIGFDPPPASMSYQFFPGSATGGNDWNTTGHRLGNRDAEVFRFAGHDK